MNKEPFEDGNYFHVFNRGNNKENIFKEEINYQYFITLIKKYLLEICDIYAYCLLPNHFHLLLKVKDFNLLPDIYKIGKKKIHQPFSNLFNSYSKSINTKYNRTGSLFQEHLHRNKIQSENYIKELILYIHLNPEKHLIHNDFSKYNHSSYKAYLSLERSLLKRDEILPYFDSIENFIHCHQNKKVKLDILKEINEIDY